MRTSSRRTPTRAGRTARTGTPRALFANGCRAAAEDEDEAAKDDHAKKDDGAKKDQAKKDEHAKKDEKAKKDDHEKPKDEHAPNTCPSGMAAITDSSLSAVQGGTSTGTFTIAAGCAALKVSLVSYSAPGPSFDAAVAHLQKVFDSKTGTFGPGPHTLAVSTPNCFYQVDLVLGDVIPVLSSSNLYGPAGRLIRAVNGGSGPCVEAAAVPPPAPTTTTTPPLTTTPTATPVVNAPAVTTVVQAPPAPPAGQVLGAATPASAPAPAAVPAPAAEQPAPGVLGAAAPAPEAIAETASGELPFTGIPLWIAALLGAGLLAAGLVLRRASAAR